MTQYNFKAETCHEIGFGWYIAAPKELNQADIESLIDTLTDYTDEPCQAELADFMRFDFDESELDKSKKEYFAKVLIRVESVHRESYSQNIEPINQGKTENDKN